jgi:activator of 2-hydroxyglutaryl-CoA dehydratase
MTYDSKEFSVSNHYYLGFDIGSTSLNTVILDENDNIVEEYYEYVHGRPFNVLYNRLTSLLEKIPGDSINSVALTGTGGKLAAELIGGSFVNEII